MAKQASDRLREKSGYSPDEIRAYVAYRNQLAKQLDDYIKGKRSTLPIIRNLDPKARGNK